jgi:rhodanese-related sulfurtransferase
MSWQLDRPLLLRAAGLLLGGAVAGLGINAVRSTGVALTNFRPPTACAATADNEPPLIEMDPPAASSLCGRPNVIFADTRPAARFAEGHVAEALHLPCNATASGAEGALDKLAHAHTIIVYGESSDDSREVADTLRRRGVKGDLRVLRGGFGAWEREGLPCASGPCRECAVAGAKESHP